MKSLFIDVGNSEKIAAKKLSDDPRQWSQEIVTSLLEAAPYLSRYGMQVEFNRLDADSGYAFGFVQVTAGETTQKAVKVPFIVRNGEMAPLDLIVADKKVLPLTEQRAQEALFRPQVFDSVVREEDLRGPWHTSPYGSTLPPGRDGIFPSATVKASSLVARIKDTILEEDLNATATMLTKDAALREKVLKNPSTFKVLGLLKEAENTERMEPLAARVTPTVMQICVIDGKYQVKTANPKAYEPVTTRIDRTNALAKLGFDIVRAVDNVGTLTVTTDTLVDHDAAEKKYASVTSSGFYKALGLDGTPIKGVVFSKVAELDGSATDLKIFATSSDVAVQPDFVGEKLGSLKWASLPDVTPSGVGLFAWPTDTGVQATVPVVVHEATKLAGQVRYVVTSFLGESASLVPSAVKNMVKLGSEVLIPSTARFVPVPGTSALALATSTDLEKRASLDKTAKVQIRHVNGRFTFTGDCGVTKVASTNLTYDEAVFLSACLGMNPEFAETKLAQAVKYTSGTTVKGLRELKPLADYIGRAKEKLAANKGPIAAFMSRLRRDMWKVAAVIEDDTSVDHVLALNYLNPNNIRIFVEAVPDFEATLTKLCELLLGARIGLKSVDEEGVSMAIKGLDQSIQGLKVLLRTTNPL